MTGLLPCPACGVREQFTSAIAGSVLCLACGHVVTMHVCTCGSPGYGLPTGAHALSCALVTRWET